MEFDEKIIIIYKSKEKAKPIKPYKEREQRICSFYTSRSSNKTSDRIQYVQRNPKITLTSSKSTI